MFRAAVVAVLCWLAIPTSLWAESRVALVVGNGAYQNTAALTNPVNDARDVAAALKAAGFVVTEALDADKAKLDAALRTFTEALSGADVALFFYAGHGLQLGLQNYLVPIDAKLERERDLEFEAMKLEFVMRQMEIEREGKISIVILDACRDNPLARNLARSMGTRSTAVGRGLAAAATGLGTFIAYSTQPGNVALDGTGRNSPFTAALVKQIGAKGRNLPATMIEVRKEVVAATDGAQVPWDHSAMTGDFYFVPGNSAPAPGSIAAAPAATSDDVAALKERLRKLEEDAAARQPASGPSTTSQADLQKRVADLKELTDSLQKRTNKAREEEASATDPAEKARLKRNADGLEAELSLRRKDLNALEAKMAGTVSVPAVTPKAALDTAAEFDLTENVRITGAQIRSFRAPSPASCRDACARDTSCLGFQHGKKIGVMGTCEIYSSIASRHEDDKWRSGVRTGTTASARREPLTPGTSAEFPTVPSWQKFGFDVYEGLTLNGGDVIKQTRVDSAAGCLSVCKNTADCVASIASVPGQGNGLLCYALKTAGAPAPLAGSVAIIRRDR